MKYNCDYIAIGSVSSIIKVASAPLRTCDCGVSAVNDTEVLHVGLK